MKRLVRAACLLMLVGLPVSHLAADEWPSDLVYEKIFGKDPSIPGPYKHPACISELDNGDLYLVYYGGSGEYGEDTSVFGSRKVKGTNEWTKPAVIADTPNRSDGNAVIWQAPDGLVWLFYVTRYGATWSDSRIQSKISKDGAKIWSDPDMLAFEKGMMVRGRPIVLMNGDYLLPIYHETGNNQELVGATSTSLFLRYVQGKNVWEPTNRVESRLGNIQPSVVQIDKNNLIAYSRRGGGYGPQEDGFLVRSESKNGGYTWSRGKDSQFPNPNSATDFIKLQNGHLLLVYNDTNMGDRMPLTVSISTDNDKTYGYKRNIVDADGSAAYPTAIQTQDGKIHIIYTSHSRLQINHLTFDEQAILNHPVK